MMSSMNTNVGAGGGIAKREKAHYSFDDKRLEDIGRENLSLLNRLSSVATRPQQVSTKPTVMKIESSAERNRKKKAAEIERQNLMLLKKLQKTKSTVSTAMTATTSRSGYSAGPAKNKGYSMKAPSSGGGMPTYRAEWVDPSTNTRTPGFGQSLAGGGNNGAPAGTRKLFHGGDMKDIALQACPDSHTLH